ncbi:MAG: hypothetical protein GY745_20875 [Actinomycetia bacterium]|nr:hypothetical protein [Actinomycetes bacterium]MCP4087476.1 hypothetical protein [Actinomycetes bacterium]
MQPLSPDVSTPGPVASFDPDIPDPTPADPDPWAEQGWEAPRRRGRATRAHRASLRQLLGVEGGESPELRAVARLARPTALAREHTLPVLEPLMPLLPDGRLRRGSTMVVGGEYGVRSLTHALVAGPVASGSWVAMVGLPDPGLLAASEVGLDLARVVVVDRPPPSLWGQVVTALADAFDLVVVAPDRLLSAGDERRVSARIRDRGTVVVQATRAASRPAGFTSPDINLDVVAATWSGIDRDGHGYLSERRVTVESSGRREAGRARRTELFLPGPDGRLATVEAPVAREEDDVVPFRRVG